MLLHGTEERRVHERSVALLRRPLCLHACRDALGQGWRDGAAMRACAYARNIHEENRTLTNDKLGFGSV